jgi:diacylglycerol kinase (ATP)
MPHLSWSDVSAYVSEYWSVLIATVIFACVGAVTIYYTVNQLNKNISLSLIKAIRARAKRYKKWKDRVPAASHIWRKEAGPRSKGLKCCVCSKSVWPLQYHGGAIHQCDICGAAAHPGCSGNAHKDCKCVSMAGLDSVLYQWAIQWIDTADHSEEDSCCYCDESCNGAFVAGSPIWFCMWCQRLVHVDCHSNLAKETGDICDLGPLKWLILLPLCVKELHWTGAAGILSSITHGANELASTVRERIRSHSKKYKTVLLLLIPIALGLLSNHLMLKEIHKKQISLLRERMIMSMGNLTRYNKALSQRKINILYLVMQMQLVSPMDNIRVPMYRTIRSMKLSTCHLILGPC